MTSQPGPNGHALRGLLEAIEAALSGVKVVDYYRQELPSLLDGQLTELVYAYTALSTDDRERLSASLSGSARASLGIFGQRAATLAVRSHNEELLQLGLVGNALANAVAPERREIDVGLAIFHHAAGKLGIPARRLFSEAARLAPESIAPRLREFGQRENVSLKQYGWREVRTTDGVRYRFEW